MLNIAKFYKMFGYLFQGLRFVIGYILNQWNSVNTGIQQILNLTNNEGEIGFIETLGFEVYKFFLWESALSGCLSSNLSS